MENTDFPFESLRETQSFIAIRPFFPVLEKDTLSEPVPLLDFAMAPIQTESVIVSVSKEKHAEVLLDYFRA
jgi:hypothetical protein